MYLVQSTIQTNKCTTYMCIYFKNILCNINNPTCFNASATSSVNLILVFAKVTKIIKILKLNKSSRLKCL